MDIRAAGADIGVDDLAVSARRSRTRPCWRAAVADRSTRRDFTFGANRPDVAEWRCWLDDADLTACTSPASYAGLAAGPHPFEVATVDSYGAIDPSPAAYAWTVLGPPPETPVPPMQSRWSAAAP